MNNARFFKSVLTLSLAFIILVFPTRTAFSNTDNSADTTETYALTVTVWVENSGAEPARDISLNIPTMAQINSPYQKVLSRIYSIEPISETITTRGNKKARLQVKRLAAGEKFPIKQTYIIKLIPFSLSKKKEEINQSTGKQLQNYLQQEEKIESDSDKIRQVANALNGDSKPKTTSETLTFAKAAYDYTRDSLQYNLNASSADKGALAGLREGEGTCVEYASLFVALNRAAGIPARIVNGFAHYSKVLADTSSSSRLEKQRHQWAEFYLPGQGWIPVDPTLGTATNSRFGSLSAGYYIIQNYGDLPISGSYKGGKLNISFDYSIEIDNVPSTL